MYKEEFTVKLAAKFSAKNDDDRNAGFKDDLILFSNICPENHLQDVYNWISLNHKYTTPFLISKIFDYAKSQGYISETKRRHDASWLTCVSCGTHYSMVGRGCPKCRSKKSTISHGETYPQNYIKVTEDCYYCTIFTESKKPENKKLIFGHDCEMHGKEQTLDYCKSCQCRECCKQKIMSNLYPKETTEKYKTGELAQPWLVEVDPLNKTVELMVKDISR